MDLIKTYRLEAAHTTPGTDGVSRLHGHSFQVEVVVSGPCDPALGWVMDYADISAQFDPLFRILDHHHLNDVEGMDDPSSEGLRHWILSHLRSGLTGISDVHVSILGDCCFEPRLVESGTALVLPDRIRFGFEAAHALPRLPEGHKCRNMHGHSFVVEVGGDALELVSARLKSLHETLDHRCLNDIAGLDNPTSEIVSRWIWNQLASEVPGLRVVGVAETCTARCIYHGD